MASQHDAGQASTSARRLDSDDAVRVPDVVSLLDDDDDEGEAAPTSGGRRVASQEPRRTERTQSVEKSPRKRRAMEAPRTLVEHAERKGYVSATQRLASES